MFRWFERAEPPSLAREGRWHLRSVVIQCVASSNRFLFGKVRRMLLVFGQIGVDAGLSL